jgi:hypothetical protein
MYSLAKSELLKFYGRQVIDSAVTIWKKRNLSDDEIADKIDILDQMLQTCPKAQFIKIYNFYLKELRGIKTRKGLV